jgi:hypothetical protein
MSAHGEEIYVNLIFVYYKRIVDHIIPYSGSPSLVQRVVTIKVYKVIS